MTLPVRVLSSGAISIRVTAYRYRLALSPPFSCRPFIVIISVDVLNGSSLVVVAAGSCDRSFRARLLPNLSFARHHSRDREQLCLVAADADVSGANSSPHGPLNTPRRAAGPEGLFARGHRIQGHIRVGPSGRDLESPGATRIEQPSLNGAYVSPSGLLVSLLLWLCFLLRCIFGRLRPAFAHPDESARHSAYVFRLVSMCQKIVANFLITATRAMPDPRRRLMRLNHSRS